MTRDALQRLLTLYRAGLDAELVVIRQLEQLAAHQQTLGATRDFDAFHLAADLRDRLTRSLLTLEAGVGPVRRTLHIHRQQAETLPEFAETAVLQRAAADRVARILTSDRDVLETLAEAEVARKAALVTLEQGERTVDAYRKSLAPPSGAVLMDRQG